MYLEYVIPAFLIGLGGSLHCVGMCGPLMFSSLISNKTGIVSLQNWLFYQTGRIGVYAVWGVVFGLIGTSARWFGHQQNISLSLGIGILLILILTKTFPKFEKRLSNIFFTQFIRSKLIPIVQLKTNGSALTTGILNGMLPCGLVYVGLAGATAMQDPLKGGLFMFFFGIGTLPLLSALLFLGKNLQTQTRQYLTKWYPVIISIMAIMLIIRGLNWGNFLSPSILPGSESAVHCSFK